MEAFWPDIDLDLTEAHLHQLDLNRCHVQNAKFDRATFTGYAWFDRATFTGEAWFVEVAFTGGMFAGYAGLKGVRMAQLDNVFLPTGWTTRPAAEGEEEGWLYVVRDEDPSEYLKGM